VNLTRGELNALRDARRKMTGIRERTVAVVELLDRSMGRRNGATLRVVSAVTALNDALSELNRQIGDQG